MPDAVYEQLGRDGNIPLPFYIEEGSRDEIPCRVPRVKPLAGFAFPPKRKRNRGLLKAVVRLTCGSVLF